MNRLTQIRDYFEGRLSQKEAEAFMQWFMAEESEEEVNAEFDKLWHSKGREEFTYKGQELYQQIIQQKENGRTLSVIREKEHVVQKSGAWSNWWRVAAAVLLLIGAVYLIQAFNASEVAPAKVAMVEVVKTNPAGQKSKVYLPDGTIVHLNSESKISFLEDFSEGRNVYLEGEAFFDVTEDPAHPFTVYSGKLATTALGTSFNIKSYNTEQVEVVLVTGKVRVKKEKSTEEVLLLPGEKASLESGNSLIEKGIADTRAITYWKDGVLFFSKTNVKEVIETLERWYGVEVEVKGNLPDVKCSGTFQKNEYMTNVLDVLSYSVGFEYSLAGKQVQIEFNQK